MSDDKPENADQYVPVSALLPLLHAWSDWQGTGDGSPLRSTYAGIRQGQEWARDDLTKVITEQAAYQVTDPVEVEARLTEEISLLNGQADILTRERDEAKLAAYSLTEGMAALKREVTVLKMDKATAIQKVARLEEHVSRLTDALEHIATLAQEQAR